jgi:hypothetical protein
VSEPLVGEVGAEAFVAPEFTIETCGMTNRQLWSAVQAELQASGRVGVAEIATWLREAVVLEVTEEAVTLGVPHDLARRRVDGRHRGAIRGALERVSGLRFELEVVLFREWQAA